MNTYKIFTTLLIATFIFSSNALARDLNVPSDEYPTIQSAIDAAESGDRVNVAPGTYDNNAIILNKSGIIIDGNNQATLRFGDQSDAIIFCENINGEDTVLKGFDIYSAKYGIRCDSSVTSLKIIGNDIKSCTYGIYIEAGAKVVIENNKIGFCKTSSIYSEACSQNLDKNCNTELSIINNDITGARGINGYGGIDLSNTIADINGNYIHDCWDSAITIGDNSNVTIIDNKISGNGGWHSGSGVNIYDSTAELRNNIIKDCTVYDSGSVSSGINASCSEVSLYNNVIYNNFNAYNQTKNGIAVYTFKTDIIARNNIINSNSGGEEAIYILGAGKEGLVDLSYNLINNGTKKESNIDDIYAPEKKNIFENPQFVDTKNFYLDILKSPCVDSGDPSSGLKDIDGTPLDMGIHGGHYGTFVDRDLDGLSDNQEFILGIDHLDADTDDDSISDGEEVDKYGSNPKKKGIIVQEGSSLQSVIDSAESGTDLFLFASDYPEAIVIEDKSISLVGQDASFNTIEGSILLKNSDSSIKNLRVKNMIIATNSSFSAKNCIIEGGVEVWNLCGSGDISPVIENNLLLGGDIYLYSHANGGAIGASISNNTLDGSSIVMRMHKECPAISNNIITNSGDAIYITYFSLYPERLAGISNNCFFNNGNNVWLEELEAEKFILRNAGDRRWDPRAAGNIFEDPEFADPENLDYFPQNPKCENKGYRE